MVAAPPPSTRSASSSTNGRSSSLLSRGRKYCANFVRAEVAGCSPARPGSQDAVSSTRSVGNPSPTSLVRTRSATPYSSNTASNTALMRLSLPSLPGEWVSQLKKFYARSPGTGIRCSPVSVGCPPDLLHRSMLAGEGNSPPHSLGSRHVRQEPQGTTSSRRCADSDRVARRTRRAARHEQSRNRRAPRRQPRCREVSRGERGGEAGARQPPGAAALVSSAGNECPAPAGETYHDYADARAAGPDLTNGPGHQGVRGLVRHDARFAAPVHLRLAGVL